MITKYKTFDNYNTELSLLDILDNDKIDKIDIDYEKNKDLLIDLIWLYPQYKKKTLSKVIKKFLENGATKIINYVNDEGDNALTSAAYFTKHDFVDFRPNFETVKLLLEYGIDFNIESDGNHFMDLLETDEMRTEIIKLYPDKIRKYLKIIKSRKFNI